MNSRRWLNKHYAILTFVLCVSIGESGSDVLLVGHPFPDLNIETIDKSIPNISDHVVLINFWASWCVPCKQSFPVMEKLYQQYKGKGFEILAVSMDKHEDSIQKFIKRHTISFDIIHDHNHILAIRFQVPAMPTSFFVDRKGVVRYIHKGFHGEKTEKELKQQIELLLKEKDIKK